MAPYSGTKPQAIVGPNSSKIVPYKMTDDTASISFKLRANFRKDRNPPPPANNTPSYPKPTPAPSNPYNYNNNRPSYPTPSPNPYLPNPNPYTPNPAPAPYNPTPSPFG